MTSLAYPGASRRTPRPRLGVLLDQHGSDVLLGVVLTLLVAALLSRLTSDFNVDSWLALVDGRYVAAHGLPHRDTMTVIGAGARWIDQQWLAQLAEYELYRLGGLALLGVVNVLAFALPFVAAVVVARRHGARFVALAPILPIAALLAFPAREVRTQDLAIPFFVAVAALLSADSRAPSRRVWWCLPVITAWANLHGTVSLGVALVALRGVTVAARHRHALRHRPSAWLRPIGLIVGAPAAALVTPYGTAMVDYYRSTMGSSTLRQWVSEWQPLSSQPVLAVGVLAIVVLTIWAWRRRWDHTTAWEKLAMVMLTAGSVVVVRNVVFLALGAIITVAPALNPPSRPRSNEPVSPRLRRRLNGGLLAASVLALVLTAASALSRPDAALQTSGTSPAVTTAVAWATANDPSIRVLADGTLSDWLLWKDPSLTGRLAADARFEIYTPAQLNRFETTIFDLSGRWRAGAVGYRVVVLAKSADTSTMRALLREPGHRVLYADRTDIVILRAAREAARA